MFPACSRGAVMARSRTIKPDFFADTRLAEASVQARYLYIGLWTLFDRDGVTEDDSKLIKGHVFRYDDKLTPKRVEAMLDELVAIERVLRLEHAGKRYLYCPTFSRHQHFHRDERPKYSIPKEALSNASASTVQASMEHDAKPAVICNLKSVIGYTSGSDTDVSPPTLFEIWNQNRGPLPEAKECRAGTKRGRAAAARWAERPDAAYWTGVVRRLAASPFCRGETGGTWRATFDFLIQPDTHVKVLEGKYDPPARKPKINTTPIDLEKL